MLFSLSQTILLSLLTFLPSFAHSLSIHSSGFGVRGIFPVRVIPPAWPVWPEELADTATGLPADFTVQCGVAAQSLLSWLLQRRIKVFSHVLPKGSGRTRWQSRANKTLLTDSARSGHKHPDIDTGAPKSPEDASGVV